MSDASKRESTEALEAILALIFQDISRQEEEKAAFSFLLADAN